MEQTPRPSKVIAVHLNYKSRADERGRIPKEPSYYLKPPSSVSGDGDPIVRPRECELLNYEGEVAIVIGMQARDVTPAQGVEHIGWVAPTNDLGVYDMRWADRGSNLMAKGHDGFTPIGEYVPTAGLDLDALTIRTRVNGEVVQEDSTANLIFPFGQLVADLSRFMTLEVGDVILTGTPANSRPIVPGDAVEVEIDGIGSIRNEVVEADHDLAEYGAMPKATPTARAGATGVNVPRPVTLSDDAKAAFNAVSTATLTVQLRKHGITNTFMGGLRPLRSGMRLLGYAHTLRYVALREDVLAARDNSVLNAQKATIEALAPEDVLVIEARGQAGAGTIGDILAMRALYRGATGIVSDGGVRDAGPVGALEIPTYCQGPHAATLGLLHFPLESNVPISCAGVLVMPGDVMVGDEDGVMVIPAALAEQVAHDALEQEISEQWSFDRVTKGDTVGDVYPIAAHRKAEYEKWRAERPESRGDQS